MNNLERNAPCHCGSGKKYKNCCMRKDEAAAQLARQKFDVRRVIGPNTTPYAFWKRWSAACGRNEFGLVFDMLLKDGALSEKFRTAEDFYENINLIGLPFEPRWSLDKIKLTDTACHFLSHRADSNDRNADAVVSLMSLERTPEGYRVSDIRRQVVEQTPGFAPSFDMFGIGSAEKEYRDRLSSGWTRPDLSDESSRYKAPAE